MATLALAACSSGGSQTALRLNRMTSRERAIRADRALRDERNRLKREFSTAGRQIRTVRTDQESGPASYRPHQHFPIRSRPTNAPPARSRPSTVSPSTCMRARCWAWWGESGCGKSTTGSAMLNPQPATSGHVVFDGRELVGLSRCECNRSGETSAPIPGPVRIPRSAHTGTHDHRGAARVHGVEGRTRSGSGCTS